MSAKKAAKAVDYSTYSIERLFKKLDSTREKIEQLRNKWVQIELEIIDRHTPNDETIRAMKKCELISSNDEILEVGEVSKHFKGLVNE